jgi:hypothetical protein
MLTFIIYKFSFINVPIAVSDDKGRCVEKGLARRRMLDLIAQFQLVVYEDAVTELKERIEEQQEYC